MLTDERDNGIEMTEEISTDYCEGLSRMLSSLYSHTTNNILSATMSWKLLNVVKDSNYLMSMWLFH